MANKIPRLLAASELLDIYGIPVLSEIQLEEYFTFNEEEIKALKGFKDINEAVYFAIGTVNLTLLSVAYMVEVEKNCKGSTHDPIRFSSSTPFSHIHH